MSDPRSRGSPEKQQSAQDYLDNPRSRWTPGRPPLLGRTTSGTYRPRLAVIQSPGSPDRGPSSPGSPRTPLGLSRSFSSAFNSPGQTFRTDDEFFVFEFDERHLSVGLGGEERPRCTLDFAPENQRRVGDYSKWLVDVPDTPVKSVASLEDWGADFELWRLDVRGLDLALVADKIERAVRSAISEHVLVQDDSRKRYYSVVLPSALPHPLISTVLSTLFGNFPPPPAISLLSPPILSTAAAGVRSALVVAIDWFETTVTPVYEYRELAQSRSTRGMKLMSFETAQMVSRELASQSLSISDPSASPLDDPVMQPAAISLSETDEIIAKLAHVPHRTQSQSFSSTPMNLPVESHRTSLTLPFSSFSHPVLRTFFSPSNVHTEDPPLPTQMYTSLLQVPPDVRRALLPRLIFTGAGSQIPGLKARAIALLRDTISDRGWDPIASYGSAAGREPPPRRQHFHHPARRTAFSAADGAQGAAAAAAANKDVGEEKTNKDLDPLSTTPASMQPQLPDPVLAGLRARGQRRSSLSGGGAAAATTKGQEDGEMAAAAEAPMTAAAAGEVEIRAIKSLGAWAGASVLAGLRVKASVEVERDRFLAKGLVGYADGGDETTAAAGALSSSSLSSGGARNSNEDAKRKSVAAAATAATATATTTTSAGRPMSGASAATVRALEGTRYGGNGGGGAGGSHGGLGVFA